MSSNQLPSLGENTRDCMSPGLQIQLVPPQIQSCGAVGLTKTKKWFLNQLVTLLMGSLWVFVACFEAISPMFWREKQNLL